jgi:hypothetical protein
MAEFRFTDLMSGRIGPVRLGSLPTSIQKLAGPPDRRSVDGLIWCYGAIQVIFDLGHVTAIGAEFGPLDPPVPDIFAASLGPLGETASFSEVTELLESQGIPWTICETATDDSQIMIRLPNGASIVLGTDELGKQNLFAVSVTEWWTQHGRLVRAYSPEFVFMPKQSDTPR